MASVLPAGPGYTILYADWSDLSEGSRVAVHTNLINRIVTSGAINQ